MESKSHSRDGKWNGGAVEWTTQTFADWLLMVIAIFPLLHKASHMKQGNIGRHWVSGSLTQESSTKR